KAPRARPINFLLPLPSCIMLVYRITLSALARTFGGTVRPIWFAAFRLMINSNLIGCSTGRSGLFQRTGASIGDLSILLGEHARNADGPNNLAINENRHATFVWRGPAQPEHSQSDSAARNGILKSLGWPPEQHRRARLVFGNGNRPKLGVVEPMHSDHVSTGIDDRDHHRPVVLLGFGLRSRNDLLGLFE